MLGDTFRKQKGIKRYKRPSKGHQVVLEKKHVSEAEAPSSKIGGKDTKIQNSFRFISLHGFLRLKVSTVSP